MRQDMNVPELRFPEFEGEWEEKKFGKCINMKSGHGFKASEYSKNGVPLIKIDNVSYGKIIWENKSYLPDNYLEKYPDLLLKEGDILLALNRPITQNKLKIAVLKKEDCPSILYQRVGKIIVDKELDKKFIFYISSNYIYTFVLKSSVGSDQPFISVVELKKINIKIPTLAEQEKIASFLSKVDLKIEKLERKEELWQLYKKGMLQQLFSQELRFKDDNGSDYPDWEEKKLEDIFKVRYGKDYKHLKEGNVPVYGTGGIMSYVDKCLYKEPSVLIGRKGTINKPFFIDKPFWTVDTLFYTEIFGADPKYTYYLVLTINWLNYNEASGVPSLSVNNINKIKVKIPSLPEQTKIANFLTSIDKKIESNQKELSINKEFKKGLLQQMFPSDKKSKEIKTPDLSRLDKQTEQTALL
ncbi:MAG: restriction endonuclease subunit S [Methanobacterium sp.]